MSMLPPLHSRHSLFPHPQVCLLPSQLCCGDCHPAVKTLRLLLATSRRLQLNLTLSDRFTPEIEEAVQQFQALMFLPIDGRVGPETWRSLCADAPVHLPQLELGDQGQEVKLLQHRLAEKHFAIENLGLESSGWSAGKPASSKPTSGKLAAGNKHSLSQRQPRERGLIALSGYGQFGFYTETAVRAFQHHANLTVDGIVGRETWRALATA